MSLQISHEAYATEVVHMMGLSDATCSPKMMPYRTNLLIDMFPKVKMLKEPLIEKYRSWLGMFIWLSASTQPDFTPVVSLLSTYQREPSPGHLAAAKYAGQYLKAMKA